MRPLKLELQAFGPFVEKQTVDFEALAEKGIFLIKGNTGSGKTTIFDAMTFALYGGGSGEGSKSRVGRNDLEEWRCTQAGWETATFVAFTFSVRGRRYRFKRSLIPKKKDFSVQNEAGELDGYDNLIPFFENPKKDDLNRKAEELIGLTKEQFRQVVLLPQGQFERFLTASSDEKQGILQKIFDSARWEQYAQAFFAAAKDVKAALDDEKRDVQSALAEEDVPDVDSLLHKIEAMKREQAQGAEAHRAFDGTGKRAALDKDRILARAFQELHAREKAVRDLEAKKPFVDALRIRHAEAEKAESLRDVINEYESAQKAFQTRLERLKTQRQALSGKQQAEADAAAASAAHEQDSPVAELTKAIGEQEAKIPVYQSFGALKDALDQAEKTWLAAKRSADSADAALILITKGAAEAKAAFDSADALARERRNRYFSGIYGEIAQGLAPGAPCPVCGSTAHPHPAQKTADSISKDQVDAAEALADRKKKAWEAQESERKAGDQRRAEAMDRLNQAAQDRLKANTELTAARRSLIEGINDERALRQRIDGQKERIRQYQQDGDDLKARHEKAAKELTALKETIRIAADEEQQAGKALQTAERALLEALQEKGYADVASAKGKLAPAEARRRMHEQIVDYETSCRKAAEDLMQLRQELADAVEPDASRFDARLQEITEEANQFSRRDARLRSDMDRLTKKHRALAEKWQHYRENIRQAESDLAFAKKLRGDTGIGLQRYVLAILFNQVIGDANRMLTNVHGGRYRLFRSDEKGAGNKRGLELKVHDSRCPEKEGRSVGMLSGGEKFLVSLALSIGMSTVAQRSGVQIEALFIDEGFGTLDDSSIHDAMNVLDSVRRSNGMIGVISHVPLLEDNIPTQLHVIKRETGSAIAME